MELFLEIIKFLFYSLLLVIIAKYFLVVLIRKLAMTLNLKAKTIGNITGIATSVPELLSVCFSSFSGLISASWYNVLSSNIINFIQYFLSIFINKNQKFLTNLALKIDLVLVIFTIIIPIFLTSTSFYISPSITILFILLFSLFYFINKNAHHLYLPNSNNIFEIDIKEETKWLKGKRKKTIFYTILLLLTTISLFFIGNLLSNSLESLFLRFSIPQFIIGFALGFITSIPELITFFESQKHHKQNTHIKEGVIEATNNLLTSNILNLFIIQSIGIIIFYISN